MEGRHEGEHVGHLLGAFSVLDISSPLGPGKRVGDLNGEDVWTQQLVNPLAEFVTDFDCLVIVRFGQHPFQGHVRVEDVFHPSSRISRISGTARFTFPTRARISSRIRSMRSAARRMESGSRTPSRARSMDACTSGSTVISASFSTVAMDQSSSSTVAEGLPRGHRALEPVARSDPGGGPACASSWYRAEYGRDVAGSTGEVEPLAVGPGGSRGDDRLRRRPSHSAQVRRGTVDCQYGDPGIALRRLEEPGAAAIAERSDRADAGDGSHGIHLDGPRDRRGLPGYSLEGGRGLD